MCELSISRAVVSTSWVFGRSQPLRITCLNTKALLQQIKFKLKYHKFCDAWMYHFETFWRDLFNSNEHFTWIFLPGPWKQSIRKCTSGHDSHRKIGLELNTAALDYYIPLVDGCNLKINFYFRLAENEGMSVIKISLNIYTVCPLHGSVFQTKPWDLVWIYLSMYFTRI